MQLLLLFFVFFFLMIRRPPRSTLFPYTRSSDLYGFISQRRICFITKRRPLAHEPNTCAKQCGLLVRSEEHTSELQSRPHLVCRLLLEKKKISAVEPHLFNFKHPKRTAGPVLWGT